MTAKRMLVAALAGVAVVQLATPLSMIVRREPQGIQRYMHFGTGNYNEITARLYCDVVVANPASFVVSKDLLTV